MTPLTTSQGLALLDTALRRDEPQLIPAHINTAGLRTQGAADVPPLWRDLAGRPADSPARPPAGTGTEAGTGSEADVLRQRLARLSIPDRDDVLLTLVRQHAATVLGHASPGAVDPGQPFTDLGFDSLTAIELRNRLNAATGLRLPATLVFDWPTAIALASYLRPELVPDDGPGEAPIFAELDQLEADLSAIAADGGLQESVTRRLRNILSRWTEVQGQAKPADAAIDFESATPNEVFDFLDKELGLS
jgi:acyl carrier protein